MAPRDDDARWSHHMAPHDGKIVLKNLMKNIGMFYLMNGNAGC